MQIKINKNFLIKRGSKPLIIAEISGNHSGKKSLFLKLHLKQTTFFREARTKNLKSKGAGGIE